jgi:hypothetical protein
VINIVGNHIHIFSPKASKMNKQFVKLGFRAKKSGHPCLAFVTLLLNTFTENEKQI